MMMMAAAGSLAAAAPAPGLLNATRPLMPGRLTKRHYGDIPRKWFTHIIGQSCEDCTQSMASRLLHRLIYTRGFAGGSPPRKWFAHTVGPRGRAAQPQGVNIP